MRIKFAIPKTFASYARNLALFLAAMALLFPSEAVSQEKTPAPAKIRFLPHWLPQAQFSGYYMAESKGIYRKFGLEVEILKGGPEVNPIEMLREGRTDFISNFLSTALIAAMDGADIVNIGQFSKRSGLVYISKKKSGILAPQDMNGRKLGIWKSGFQDIPLAFNRKLGIEVKIVPILSTVNLFLLDGIDVMTVMWYNEYHVILNSGIDEDELNRFFFFNYDFNIPEDGVYCLRSTLEQKQEICRKFIKATLEGWDYAFANRDETVEAVMQIMRDAHQPANKPHQMWMLDRMSDLFRENGTGALSTGLSRDAFDKTIEALTEGKPPSTIRPEFDKFHMDCGKNAEE